MPSSFILAAVWQDIKSRSISNALVISTLVGGIVSQFFFGGLQALALGGLAALVAFLLATPMFFLKIMGGGDAKFFVAFSFALTPWNSVWVFVAALLWSGLLGAIKATLDGQLGQVAKNMAAILKNPKKSPPAALHKIPYAVGLFFAWASYVVFFF